MNFNSIVNPADRGGCGHYRCLFPSWAAQTMRRDIKISDYSFLSPSKEIFLGQRLVRVQRQVSDYQADYFLKLLIPLSKSIGFWLAYEIDDVIGKDDIPKYNAAWSTFQSDKLMTNIKTILDNVDFLTVTTEELGKYYVNKFGVKKDKVLVIPNFMPMWWIGENYSVERSKHIFRKYQDKPRIGFISSASHVDIKNQNNGIDDFTHIIDFIEENIDKYQFVCVGTYPRQLKHFVESKQIEYYSGFDILNYPRWINNLDIQLVIAPLQDNIFNRAKSSIKFTESAAMGIPCVLQDNACYERCPCPKFNNSDQLKYEVERLLASEEYYLDEVRKNRNYVDSDTSEGNNGWWLEKNINKWYDLFTVSQKTIEVNLENIKLSNKILDSDKVVDTESKVEEVKISL